MDSDIKGNLSSLSQDQAKIIIQILETLHYRPKDARIIIKIIDTLQSMIKEPDLEVPVVTISPENINLGIEEKRR